MNRRLRLPILVCLFIPILVSGQEIPQRPSARYGFDVGIAFVQAREEVLNTLRHQGPSIFLGFFREGWSGAAAHRLAVSFGFTPLTDRYSPDRSSLLFHPAVEFRYARKAFRVSEDLAVFLGGSVGWSTRFSFYENWDQAHAYWLTSSQLGFAATLLRELERGKSLRLELDTPLLALVSRPPERFEYKEVKPDFGWVLDEIHRDPRLTSIHEHTAVRARLAYRRAGGAFVRSIFWEAAFTSTRLPRSRPFTSLSYMLGISHLF